ncbi:TPA: hypothetical protein EYP13_04535 [Candidatus Micrarchaeota archaeon]|nr:hypothetical protein [Candidatus Micrarchaeota archaeon]
MGKKACPALQKALKRHGLEGLIERYPDEWKRAHQIGRDPTMDQVERTKRIIETFLTMVEERLEEEHIEEAYPDLQP